MNPKEIIFLKKKDVLTDVTFRCDITDIEVGGAGNEQMSIALALSVAGVDPLCKQFKCQNSSISNYST